MSEETEQAIALVTGANKGIGFEISRGLAERGVLVLMGARDFAKGEAAAELLSTDGLNVRPVKLDVTDQADIDRLAADTEAQFGRLDILVNNAGINLENVAGLRPSTAPIGVVRQTYETNCLGPIAMIEAMLPLLRKSRAGRIVNMSSDLGSLANSIDPEWPYYGYPSIGYATSKSALNAVTIALSKDLADTPIKINSVCPGLTATDLSGKFGDRTPAQGARIAVEMALIGPDGPTGGFFNDSGRLPF